MFSKHPQSFVHVEDGADARWTKIGTICIAIISLLSLHFLSL